jgi:hypothetical protein
MRRARSPEASTWEGEEGESESGERAHSRIRHLAWQALERMRIDEARLVEGPRPHCGHLEHRAFGESESRRGELASYALGWTSGHEDVVGHMTIGIGAGNPGGGSFHVEVGVAEDGTLAMRLVDRPFEDGPDLTREQALAHPDLKCVWFVADEVLRQDRRAWWMEHYLRGTRAFVTEPVVHGKTVLGVVLDLEPGQRADREDRDRPWLRARL